MAPSAPIANRASDPSAKNFNVSLDTALEVFSFFLGRREGLGLADLSRQTGMYKSRIFRIVKTFEKHEFLELNTETLKYEVGPRLKIFSFMEDGKAISRRVHRVLERLSKETQGTVILRRRVGWELLTLDVVVSDHPLRISAERGRRFPVTFGAQGKVFVAYDNPPLEDVLKNYRYRLPRFTDRSITDPEKWRRLIVKVRSQGYAFSDGEAIVGGRAVGMPILSPAGKLIAAISIAMPKTLFPLRELPRVVARGKQAAQALGEILSGEF